MFTISRPSGGLVIATACLGALVGVLGSSFAVKDGAGHSGLVNPNGRPVQYAVNSENANADERGSATASDAINGVLAQMGSRTIRSMRLVAAPDGQGLVGSVPWIDVTVESTDTRDGADVRLAWESSLAVGAVVELIRTDEPAVNSVVGGSRTLVHNQASGETRDIGGGVGYVSLGQVFASETSTESGASIQSRAERAFLTHGLKPTRIQVLRPLGVAVAVNATVEAGAKIGWTLDELRDALQGESRQFEGIYIELDDADTGDLLVRAGTAYRTGLGGVWFADGQDARFGIVHGGPPEERFIEGDE